MVKGNGDQPSDKEGLKIVKKAAEKAWQKIQAAKKAPGNGEARKK